MSDYWDVLEGWRWSEFEDKLPEANKDGTYWSVTMMTIIHVYRG